jgi:multimeric flavodoxin WrbA
VHFHNFELISPAIMKLLALSCGPPGGNTELVLLAALQAVQVADPALTIELIRVNELKLGPMNIGGMTPHPFSGANQNKDKERMGDDGSFVLDHIMEADAIILGAPVFSRCASWTAKWFADHVMGPFQDIVAARKMVADGKGQLVDHRIFKPRVAGLISLGGALGTEWSSFGLPTLHQVFFSPWAFRLLIRWRYSGPASQVVSYLMTPPSLAPRPWLKALLIKRQSQPWNKAMSDQKEPAPSAISV